MSEESKKMITSYYQGRPAAPFGDAYAIAKEYAGSDHADPEKIPALIENLIHLFETGELKK